MQTNPTGIYGAWGPARRGDVRPSYQLTWPWTGAQRGR
jgi:hypothetical protein